MRRLCGVRVFAVRALLVVFSDSVSEAGDGVYNEWYTEVHIPDVLAVPGYVSATRYRAFPGGGDFEHRYVALYELEVMGLDELQRVSDEHMRRIREGEMRRSPPNSMNSETYRAMYFLETGPRLGDGDDVPGTVFLPFTDPALPDVEDEFNRWYQDTHLPEVLAVPGFVAASRWVETGINMLGLPWVSPHRYLAVYELASQKQSDFEATMAELRRRIAEGDRMEISSALGSAKMAQAFQRISDRIYT